jgi:hypothetical protein
MIKKSLSLSLVVSSLVFVLSPSAVADTAKLGQSITHMKTAPGLTTFLEGAGVILYSQGGATSAIIGDSIVAANGQIVFHIPITGSKAGRQHIGSTLVFFNTANNKEIQLRNPVIKLATGVVTALLTPDSNVATTILTIPNASTVKPKIKNDRPTRSKTSAYTGVQLVIAPGVAAVISSLLGLPDGAIADGTPFGSADLTIYSAISKR